MDRADTRSVARSFNETIIRPVTRRLQSAAGTSTRSNRSTRTSEDGRTMAEKDGGSSFVVSPRQQLYRLQVSPSFIFWLRVHFNNLLYCRTVMDLLNHYNSVLESQPIRKQNLKRCWRKMNLKICTILYKSIDTSPSTRHENDSTSFLILPKWFWPTWFYSINVIFQWNWPKSLFDCCLFPVYECIYYCIDLLSSTWIIYSLIMSVF